MSDQPTLEIDKDDTKWWWLNNKFHREDGPAVEFLNGGKMWYLNGIRHREDGPAIERSDGAKIWLLNGIQYDFDEWLDENTTLSDEEKIMIKLIYG